MHGWIIGLKRQGSVGGFHGKEGIEPLKKIKDELWHDTILPHCLFKINL